MGLLNHLKDAVHYVGSKLANGVSYVGDKVSKIGNTIGNIADTIATPISFIAPEVGAGIKAVGSVAKTVAGIGKDAKNMADSYRTKTPPNLSINNTSSAPEPPKISPGISTTPISQVKNQVGSIGSQMPSIGDVKSGLSEGVSSVKSMLPNFRFA